MSVIDYLKGELEAIATLIDQKTTEIEQLAKRKSDIEKEINSPVAEEAPVKEEAPVETKKETTPEEVEEALEEGDEKVAYSSWNRDELKSELASRNIKFAKNAKTAKLVTLLEESDK